MTDREKLIKLVGQIQDCGCDLTDVVHMNFVENEYLVSYLIANGVTFATDNNVGSKWIPVTERLPKTIQCGAGTEYSETINVLTSGRKVLTAIWDGYDFIADAEFWEAENEEITHWTPVLLPLPEAPKEVE